MAHVIKVIAAVALVAAGFGCATTDVGEDRLSPTHRWVAQKDVSKAKYNFDNKRCTDESSIDDGPLTKSSPEFIAYERCMEGRGYKLASFVPVRYPGRHP